mmetsp:Transcript_47909/g.35120  ORF Transcript_47909/g.35120 Transcript_47909/m.35120 type:complete len:90 (+) Transcript_47909:185-454(+)
MNQTWIDFADQQRDNGEINVGKVDCTSSRGKPVCDAVGVKGYPTLVFFENGKGHRYNGQRTMQGFVEFGLQKGWEKEESFEVPPKISEL